MHVLLADDDRDSVESLAALLKLLAGPVELTLAFDGVDLLEAATADGPPYDALITDIEMPRMDGITAVNKIKSELGEEAPVLIALTGHRGAAKLAANGVFDHVLLKPLDIEALLELLQ